MKQYSMFMDTKTQCCVDSSASFASQYKLQNQFADVHKIACLNFDWDCGEYIDQTEN